MFAIAYSVHHREDKSHQIVWSTLTAESNESKVDKGVELAPDWRYGLA